MQGDIRLYHVDHLGSTSLVTDIDGEITQHVAYIPYGEIFVEQRNGSWNTPYLFNAKELDEETGLYYYGARYLDPTNAAWLSVDPLFEKYVGMTPYGYCAGNPVKLVDVDGRELVGSKKDKRILQRHMRKIHDKSLLQDYLQIKNSPIAYYLDYSLDNEDEFGCGMYFHPSLMMVFDVNATDFGNQDAKDQRVVPFIKFNPNQRLKRRGIVFSRVVNESHEINHAAVFDACVRYFDLNDTSIKDVISDFLKVYESDKDAWEGFTGSQIYNIFYQSALDDEMPDTSRSNARAIKQETKVAIDQGDIKPGEVTRKTYRSSENE